MSDGRVRWLVVMALVLAALRFVVVPWTQSQVQQREQLEVLTQRLDRSAAVVEDKKVILGAQGKLRAAAEATRRIFPAVEDKERFRLDAQRQLSAIAARGGVRMSLFDWVMDGEAPKAGLAYGRVNAALEGPLDSLVAVHGQIEAEMPFAAIREVRADFGQQGAAGVSAVPSKLEFVMDLYYRPAATTLPAPGGGK